MAQNTYLETIDRIVENLEMSDDEVVLDDTYGICFDWQKTH